MVAVFTGPKASFWYLTKKQPPCSQAVPLQSPQTKDEASSNSITFTQRDMGKLKSGFDVRLCEEWHFHLARWNYMWPRSSDSQSRALLPTAVFTWGHSVEYKRFIVLVLSWRSFSNLNHSPVTSKHSVGAVFTKKKAKIYSHSIFIFSSATLIFYSDLTLDSLTDRHNRWIKLHKVSFITLHLKV